MGIDQLPSGAFRARLQINGQPVSDTFDNAEDAEDWIIVTKARAITGTLPGRITVREYAARWILGYDVGPSSTRKFHESNLRLHVFPAFGARPFKGINQSDVTRMLNRIRQDVSAAKADSVYRTLSALCNSAGQDDVIPSRRCGPRSTGLAGSGRTCRSSSASTPHWCCCNWAAGSATPQCCSCRSARGSGRSPG